MKVLYFVGTLGAGGIERFVTRVCIHASSQALFEPMVCCLSKREGLFLQELQAANIPVYEAPPNWARSVKQALLFRKLIRKIHPDVVHSMVNFSLAQQSFAIVCSKIRFFVTERSCYKRSGFRRLRKMLQVLWVMAIGGKYSGNSIEVSRYIAKIAGVSPKKIKVVPNGVQLGLSNVDRVQEIRKKIRYNDSDVIIGCVGSLTKNKRQSKLIDAAKILLELGEKIKIVLVGDGPEKIEIQTKVNEYLMDDSVYMTGIIDNVEDYLEAMDIFVLLSEREGMPNAILEAMAAGKPVLATSVGGIPELILDGETGILLRQTESVYMAAKLRELINNPEMRNRLGKNAKEHVLKNYGIDRIVKLLMEQYSL